MMSIRIIGNRLLAVTRQELFSFPDPVNETSARLVAGGVITLAALFLISGNGWILLVLALGFAARVATGPTLSPLGTAATRWLTPWIERRFGVVSRRVPGPPKRFAQAIGLGFTGAASIAWLFGAPTVAVVLTALLIGAAFLEAAFAICLGCRVYQAIWGCDECADIGDRLRALTTSDVA